MQKLEFAGRNGHTKEHYTYVLHEQTHRMVLVDNNLFAACRYILSTYKSIKENVYFARSAKEIKFKDAMAGVAMSVLD